MRGGESKDYNEVVDRIFREIGNNAKTTVEKWHAKGRHTLTHQRPYNTRNAVHGTKEPLERRTLLQRLGHGDDQIRA